MNALTVNLASRPFRNNTVIGSTVAAVALALALATTYNLYIFLSYGSSYAMLLDDQERNRTKLAALEIEEQGLLREIERRDFETAFDRGRFANELILRRTFSWTELFNELESVVPAEAMMAAIRPNVTSGGIVIRVEGVAKNQGAFIRLQDDLLTHESFSNVYPSSERRLNPSRPEISFILNFDYRPRPATPDDTVVAAAGAGAPRPAAATPAIGTGGASASVRGGATSPQATGGAVGGLPPRRATGSPVADGDPETQAMLPVGRDGRPRTLEVIARRMVAPGGVFDPDLKPPPRVAAPPQRVATKQSSTGTKPPEAGSPQAAGVAPPGAVPGPEGAGIAPAGSQEKTVSEAAPAVADQGAMAAGVKTGPEPTAGIELQSAGGVTPAVQGSPPPAQAAPPPVTRKVDTPPLRSRLSRDETEGVSKKRRGGRGRSMTPGQPDPATAGSPSPKVDSPAAGVAGQTSLVTGAPEAASPAVGVDRDLDFSDRPVSDVYRILGEAHGVKFVIDPAVDQQRRISLDLSGRSLAEGIDLLSRVLPHRITRMRPAIYRVSAAAGGAQFEEPPLEEEDLTPPEAKR